MTSSLLLHCMRKRITSACRVLRGVKMLPFNTGYTGSSGMKEQCSLHMRTCKRYGELTLRGGLRAFILACSRSKKASVFAESSGRRPHCSPFVHLALLAFHPHRSPSIAAGTFASTAVEALANVRCLLAKPSNKIVSQRGPHAPALRMDPPIPFTHRRKRNGFGTG
jgi:hypothetical protein